LLDAEEAYHITLHFFATLSGQQWRLCRSASTTTGKVDQHFEQNCNGLSVVRHDCNDQERSLDRFDVAAKVARPKKWHQSSGLDWFDTLMSRATQVMANRK
jgi:uncharacterized Fe-S center protein